MRLEKILFLAFFTVYLCAGEVQEAREERLKKHNTVTEVKGIDPEHVTKASNGNIYIQNARVYSGSEDNPDGRVSVDAGTGTRKIIIKNVRVNSRHNSSNSGDSSDAVLSISAKKNTSIHIKNSNIKSHNVDLTSSSNDNKACAGALCIQSDQSSDILVENTHITTSATEATVAANSNSKKKCAGALCIQTEDSTIEVEDVDIVGYGSNDFEISE